jgi:predicted membrane protein
MGLIRLIIIFIIIYFILKVLFRYVFPYLLAGYVNKKMNEMNQRQNEYFNSQKGREGDVTINFDNSNSKKNKTNSGEYVDFEEIKD